MQCIEAAHQHRVNMPPNAAEHSGVRAGSSASSSTRGCLAHSRTASQATKTPSHLKRSESESKESATTEMAHPYLSELKTCLTSPTLGPSLGSHPHPQRRDRRAPERLASQGELALALRESEGEGAEREEHLRGRQAHSSTHVQDRSRAAPKAQGPARVGEVCACARACVCVRVQVSATLHAK